VAQWDGDSMMIHDDPLIFGRIILAYLGMRLGVSTNYLMHGFIWNYPERFAALCQKAPLKSLGSHPVDVFASLEADPDIFDSTS
jgi:hypothetical protein